MNAFSPNLFSPVIADLETIDHTRSEILGESRLPNELYLQLAAIIAENLPMARAWADMALCTEMMCAEIKQNEPESIMDWERALDGFNADQAA